MKKVSLFIMLLMTSSLTVAQSTTNSIFIDQVGDGSTITITQKGQANKIGSEETRVVIEGNNQTLEVKQEGKLDNCKYCSMESGDSKSG